MSRRQRVGWTLGLPTLALSYLPTVLAGNPMVILIPNTLQFSKQVQGTSSRSQRVVLSNNGNDDLLIQEITIGGENATDFSQTNDCPITPATLAPGHSCTAQVVFKPTGTGEEKAALMVSDNASGSPQTVPLSGTATPPVSVLKLTPAKLDFGNHAVDTASVPLTITLANTGSAPLNLTENVVITGENSTEFRLARGKTSCPTGGGQVAPGSSCEVAVIFAPTALGRKSAELIVSDDAEGSPHAVPLAGVGTPQ